MLTLPATVRVFASTAPCDMRKQMDGLAALVSAHLGREPRSGDMYVFRNRRCDMVKVLFYDQQGYCLLVKRLDKGTFKLSVNAEGALELTIAEFSQLMKGIEVVRKTG